MGRRVARVRVGEGEGVGEQSKGQERTGGARFGGL